MTEEFKGYIKIAIFLLVLWGLIGLIQGDGFLNGIGKQIDGIGDIVSILIKLILAIGVIWFIISLFKK
jgi:hypothetical protein